MEIITVKTKDQLKELYDSSAMTWEGLREEDYEIALQECGQAGAKGYVTKGSVMNKLCKLTGDNAYPDDLNIFSIKDFQGLAIQYGARWIDDVIDNNARREKYHPFGGSHYGN
jgi:hypothetical protein